MVQVGIDMSQICDRRVSSYAVGTVISSVSTIVERSTLMRYSFAMVTLNQIERRRDISRMSSKLSLPVLRSY
jgi:hypothetical protein